MPGLRIIIAGDRIDAEILFIPGRKPGRVSGTEKEPSEPGNTFFLGHPSAPNRMRCSSMIDFFIDAMRVLIICHATQRSFRETMN